MPGFFLLQCCYFYPAMIYPLLKWVHAGLFAVLVVLFMWPVAVSGIEKKAIGKWLLFIAIAGSGWGLITEIIQHFVQGRNFDLIDWAADTAGTILSFVFVNVLLQRNK